MKAFISKTSRPLSQGLGLCLLMAGSFLPCYSHATDLVWDNSGTITTTPQIDATTFINSGTIRVGTSSPFETSHTLNYTNSGIMTGSPGWFFDDAAPSAGNRTPSDNFVNLNDGVIRSLDVAVILSGIGGGGSYLWVFASNVVNQGTLSVGGNGWLQIKGTNVNMARGALEVTPLQPSGSFTIGQSNFLNDVGISDLYWGQTNGFTFNSAGVYNGTRATAPPHFVFVGVNGGGGTRSFSINQPFTYGYSNTTDFSPLSLTNSDGSVINIQAPSNIVKQAVFVGIANPTIMSSAVTFLPSTSVTNPMQTVCVELALQSTNVITGQIESIPLFFYDTLASETNRGLFLNIGGTAPPPLVTERPANYLLSRIDDGRFAAGRSGNITPDASFLYDGLTFTNRIVTGEYAGYGAFVDNLASEPPPTTPGTVTNFPGRVQIYADSLDMRDTRIRGEGEVIVKANHLLSSSGAAVDCENLSYTLGSTNGNLNVTGLSKQSVIRLKGNLYAWSGLWTNQMTVVYTNNYTVTNTLDTNGVIIGTNAVQAPITNVVGINLHALILDGTGLAARLPVITWDLVTSSTNLVLSDSLSVVQSLLLNGESLTINGTLALTSTTLRNNTGQSVTTALRNWIFTNAPGLLFFTNNGTLTVPSEGHFGDDRPVPYSDFINTGTLTGGSLDVASAYMENDGALSSTVGPVNLIGTTGKFQNGSTTSRGDLNLGFTSAKFNNHQLSASGTLNFTITDGLSDAGAGSASVFRAQNGFNLLVKPNHGDLIGTTFQSQPPNFVQANHIWAGKDRLASAAGYSDNTALGKLILTPLTTNPAQAPLFFFAGVGGQNGLYVDLLDLTSLSTNYLAMLRIDPSLTIYYAAAKISFTPPPNGAGIPQEPEEFLNGQFGGHLQWVNTFAGPNSSVDVVINGVTVAVNRALRFSKIIDSNGNGIPNFYDPFPFSANPLVLTASLVETNQPPSGSLSISWNAAPKKAYQVEFTQDIRNPNWQPLTQYTNPATTNSTVTIWDTNAPAGTQRFYRVKTTQ